MRSLIILEVEHGEDTDTLQDLIESSDFSVGTDYYGDGAVIIKDIAVRVDLPECFMLDSGSPTEKE